GLGPLECGTCSARSWTGRESLPEPDPDAPPVPDGRAYVFGDDRRCRRGEKRLRRNGQGMTDTNKPGDKTITVAPPSKTLTLSGKPGGPTTVRQNFSHGRSKPVVVEVAKKRTITPPSARPQQAAPATPAARPATPPPTPTPTPAPPRP